MLLKYSVSRSRSKSGRCLRTIVSMIVEIRSSASEVSAYYENFVTLVANNARVACAPRSDWLLTDSRSDLSAGYGLLHITRLHEAEDPDGHAMPLAHIDGGDVHDAQ